MQFSIHTSQMHGASVSIVEMVGHNVEIAVIPRDAMAAVSRNRDLLDHRRWGRTGIYLLLGLPNTPNQIYVGSAADILSRPRDPDHWNDKPWWSRAVLIFSDGIGAGQHEQLERLVGLALKAATPGILEVETRRLPRDNQDWAVSPDVRRAVLPCVEAVLHLFGLYVAIPDPTDA